MSSVVCPATVCQPDRAETRAGEYGSERPSERTHGPGPEPKAGRYRLDRSTTYKRPGEPEDLGAWLQAAQKTFSAPSQERRGEKVFALAVDSGPVESSRAGEVPEAWPPARRLPGATAPKSEPVSSLLDYRLTQGEIRKEDFRTLWGSYVSSVKDTYKYRAVIAGDVIEVYEYEDLQVSQKGKSCKDRKKREDRTDEDREKDRKRNLWRARKGLIRTINANVGEHGRERAKFFTMTYGTDHETYDVKEGNTEFNKFIKRLEYRLKRKVHYTAITRFQDGHRQGGKEGGREGVIHHHVVFYDLPYVPHEKVSAIWGWGFVWINAIDDVDNLGVYVVEGYMGKEMDDPRLNGQKHYWSSRGLVKPKEIAGNVDPTIGLGIAEREPVYHASFTSEYVGNVHYRQYNLKREGNIYERKKKERSAGRQGASGNDHGTPGAGVGLVPALREGLPPGRREMGRETGDIPVCL